MTRREGFLGRFRSPLIRLLPPRVVEAMRYVRHGRLNWDETPLLEGPLVGMTTHEEQRCFTQYAREVAELDGAIVDLGCWMCSTALSLARGCNCDADPTGSSYPAVYALDRFLWETWMNPYLSDVFCDYLPGDSFLPEVRRRVSRLGQGIKLIQADLMDYVWDQGPIKLLLVDAMKSHDLARAIATRFYPSLVEKALIVHQDFKHWYTSWIHVLQYRLRDYCDFKHEVEHGGTVTFQVRRKMPAELLHRMADLRHITADEVGEAMGYSMSLVSDTGKPSVAAAHVMHFIHAGQLEEAENELRRYLDLGVPCNPDVEQAADELRRRKREFSTRKVASCD